MTDEQYGILATMFIVDLGAWLDVDDGDIDGLRRINNIIASRLKSELPKPERPKPMVYNKLESIAVVARRKCETLANKIAAELGLDTLNAVAAADVIEEEFLEGRVCFDY